MIRIRIEWPGGGVTARLHDTPCARAVSAVLPCSSTSQTWGDEIYFGVPVRCALEPDARDVVDPGTVCFWVEGASIALPFGPTPASVADECRLVTAVNILGAIEDDPSRLREVPAGATIHVRLLR